MSWMEWPHERAQMSMTVPERDHRHGRARELPIRSHRFPPDTARRMFKKPKKNFRQRNAENEENEDAASAYDSNEGLKQAPSQAAGPKVSNDKKVTKEKAAVPDHLLSFDHDEEEGDVFTIKKSNYSKKVAKKLKKEQQKEKEGVGGSSGGGSLADGSRASSGTSAGAGSGRRAVDPEERIVSGEKALDMDIDSEDERGGPADGTSRRPPARHTFTSVLERGEIPDAKLIHMARVKRQMAREMGDYIPVDDTAKVDRHAAKSRLVREDENDGTDDEDERIDFSVNIAARERQKMKDSFLAAEHGSDTESEHEREWEEQQIRKAVGPQQQPQATTLSQQAANYNVPYAPAAYQAGVGIPTTVGGSAYMAGASSAAYYSAGSVQPAAYASTRQLPSRALSENVTAEQIRRLVKERLDSLDEVHRVHTQELANVAQGLLSSQETVDSLESRSEDSIVVQLEARYKFFQEMRGFVRDFCDCFNEKFQRIGELDAAMLSLARLRAEKLVKRRQDDIRDQANECSAMSKAGVTADSSRQDEARQRRAAEREARRSRRRRARLDRELRDHNDGMSSDDEESQSDLARLTVEREKIMRDAQLLFDDVVDDFCQFEPIKARFEQWKARYGDSYRDAYISLCLPKIFTPLIKLQLVDWNPLLINAASVEQMDWFRSLLFYGSSGTDDRGPQDDDDDGDTKLLASIVEKVLIPKLTGLVEATWDPTSYSQTTRLTALLRHLVSDYPTLTADSKNTLALFGAVTSRIRRSLDEDVFMPLYSKELLDKYPAARSYLLRQFWSAAKLLRNVASFALLLSDRLLMELCLDCLLNRYIMLGLQCCSQVDSAGPVQSESAASSGGTMRRIQFLVDVLPKHWFKALPGDSTLPQLENFCRFLNATANALYKASLDPSRDSKTIRENIKQISRVLVSIHAQNHAAKMANDYSFKLS